MASKSHARHDRDDPLVGHAGGADDAEDAHHGVAVAVGRGDHAAVIEDTVSRLVADEDLHAFGLEALIEQVQEVALLVEGLEQPAQLLDTGELGDPHEVRLALDHVFDLVLAAGVEHLLSDGDGIQHDLIHVSARLGELAQQLLAHLAQRAAAELLVEVIRGTLELVRRIMALELDDAVLHLAVVEHQHDEHPVLREPDEFHLRHRRLAGTRQGDDTRELRGGGKQLRHGRDELGRVVAARLEMPAHLGRRRIIERAQLQQRVDEEAVALVGRHAPGRRVGRGDESKLLQIRHDVADRGRRQLQPRLARERARADRLAIADVALDEGAQQLLRSLAEVLVPGFRGHITGKLALGRGDRQARSAADGSLVCDM